MQDNFNTYSLIEDYLSGNLGGKEKLAFEKQLESNPELQTLVDDYSLVDILIEENELATVNDKLSQIHTSLVQRKKLVKGLISLSIIALITLGYFFIPNNEIVDEKIEIGKEEPKSISYLVTESTPFKIMDSTSEVELSTSIQQSKENVFIPELIDSVLNDDKTEETKPKDTLPFIPQKPDSIIKPSTVKVIPSTAKVVPSIKVRLDSSEKITCDLTLELSDVKLTSSCSERNTGSIQFTKANSEFLYSINEKRSYSSNPNFTSLGEGNYWVNIKNKLNNCESEPIELVIEGYKCNYVIHPEQLIYMEKSLEKFQDENSVEVLIFNRNGGLVFNKTISTNEKFYWEGNSNTNLPTPMGAYTYLIKSGNKVSKGEVTIIR